MTLKPPPKGFLVNFSQFLDAAHISTLNCNKIAGDRPRQFAYEIFSIERTFFRNLSFDFLNSRSLPYDGLKFKYSFKMH